MAIKHYGFAKWNQESYDESETGGVLDNIRVGRPVLDSTIEANAKEKIEAMERESLRVGHINNDGSIEWEE